VKPGVAERILERKHPDLAARTWIVAEREAGPIGVHLIVRRGHPVAEPAVDRSLRRPQNCERLAARAQIVELTPHQLCEDALPAVAREHGDPGDAAGWKLPAGDGQREREIRR
jgi:hypothetical protein